MSVTKFRAALGSGGNLMEFMKFGAWKGLVDGNVGITLFVHGPTGELVGEDEHGNKYFEAKTAQQGRHRWVVYKELDAKDPTTIPPQWHSWVNYISDDGPHTGAWASAKFTPPHQPLKSGVVGEMYQPKGSYLNEQRRKWKKMEYWTPN
mmetsp:Transcript_28438/g.80251  ORF Transcript_28438/g.80251 Transcript_28438/m.80251 type:complete len:149 (-) Transcript_28438:186-632(-)